MLRKSWRTYLLVAIALLGVDWGVGVARFYWPVFSRVFGVINFPWSILYLWVEKQPTPWWHKVFGPSVNDEIGQGVAFLLMVVLQAAIFTTLLLLSKRWRMPKESGTTVGG